MRLPNGPAGGVLKDFVGKSYSKKLKQESTGEYHKNHSSPKGSRADLEQSLPLEIYRQDRCYSVDHKSANKGQQMAPE